MITFFTTAKPFRGHSAIIQRNALKSWKLLHLDVEVILFGNDDGASEVAHEFGLRHEPDVARNAVGLPYMNYMFDRANEIASHSTLCYANCDIILTSDFLEALARVREAGGNFLMVGKRWDAEIRQAIDFSNPRWSEEIHRLARKANSQQDDWTVDYFLFPRGFFYKKIPEFVVGRPRWDNWTVWKALDSGALVVDASAAVLATHQNHGYSAHPQGRAGVWADESSRCNIVMSGGRRHLRKIADATKRLTPEGLKPNRARHWHGAIRVLQSVTEALMFGVWMPVWHFCLGLTRPLRTRFGLRSKASRQASPKESVQADMSVIQKQAATVHQRRDD
jgi:hypothetical protein